MNRKEFLVLYDYGQGGLWRFISAESADQIHSKYSDLVVYAQAPAQLSDETLREIRRLGVVDIDDPPSGWLADLVRAAAGDSVAGER